MLEGKHHEAKEQRKYQGRANTNTDSKALVIRQPLFRAHVRYLALGYSFHSSSN
jgi:hypothetical protein